MRRYRASDRGVTWREPVAHHASKLVCLAAMRKTLVVLGLGSLAVVACAGGVKGLQDSSKNLGNDIADSSVTKDIADAGTNAGNDIADSSVTKDVADAGKNTANDIAPNADAGGPPDKKKPKPKPKPKK